MVDLGPRNHHNKVQGCFCGYEEENDIFNNPCVPDMNFDFGNVRP